MNRSIFSLVSTVSAAIIIWSCASYPPLIKAAYDGDVHRIQALLKQGTDVNMKGGRFNETALIAAAMQGRRDTVQSLLDSGADVHLISGSGDSALTGAAWGCFRDVAALLIAHGADINAQNRLSGYTPLLFAVECNDLILVKYLIEHGADVNIRNKSGTTPLMAAAWQNNAEISEILIDAGAEVDAPCSGGGTPLYEAATQGYANVVRMLVEKGANVNFTSNYLGWTPLMMATAEDFYPIAATLVEAGAKIDVVDQNGFTPLLMAAYNGDASIAKILCEHGAQANRQEHSGWTALQYAAYYQYEDVAALLLMYHASVGIANKDGHDALWYAEKSKNQKVVNMLKNPDDQLIAKLTNNIKPPIQKGRINNATMELVRSAKPLDAAYSNIIVNRFEIAERFKKDYPETAAKCRQSLIEHLQHKNVYKNVTESASSPDAGKTVLVDCVIEDIHLASIAGRVILGPLAGVPHIDVRIKLTDAESRTLIHEETISANANGWFAGVTMGTTDTMLPARMGALIAEYLYTIIPAEPLSVPTLNRQYGKKNAGELSFKP